MKKDDLKLWTKFAQISLKPKLILSLSFAKLLFTEEMGTYRYLKAIAKPSIAWNLNSLLKLWSKSGKISMTLFVLFFNPKGFKINCETINRLKYKFTSQAPAKVRENLPDLGCFIFLEKIWFIFQPVDGILIDFKSIMI